MKTGLCSAVLLLLSFATAWAQVITEPVNDPGGGPLCIAQGSDGNLWFVENSAKSIARMTTGGTITHFTTGLMTNPQLEGIVAGPDGNLWFTDEAGRIGKITTSGVITEFNTPTTNSRPRFIAVGPDGALWFTEQNASKIGRITTAGVVTNEFPLSANAAPVGIALGPDNNLWYTDIGNGGTSASKIGRITTAGVFTEFTAGLTVGSQPVNIVAGADNNLWFTEFTANGSGISHVGRITTSGTITEFATITHNSGPNIITSAPDGAIWFTEAAADGSNVSHIGRITTGVSPVLTEYSTPTANSGPAGITPGPDGAIWFTEEFVNKVGRIALPHVTVSTSPNTSLSVLVQSVSQTAPYTFLCPIGSTETIGVTSPQAAGANQQYVFNTWIDDNVSLSRSISCPSVDTTYTAVFSPQYKINLATSPAGHNVTLDGGTVGTPTSPFLSAGTHSLGVPSPQAGATGTQYLFASWSDAQTQTHNIDAAGSAGLTFTANLTTQFQLTTSVSPSGGGTINQSAGFYNSGTVLSMQATPNPGFLFTGWTGDLTGTTNPQSLTMSAPRSVTANFSAATGVTVTTNPPGLTIVVDGTSFVAPQTFSFELGSDHTIAVNSPQAGAVGTRYAFTSWSDSGAQSHHITAPATPTVFTANFTTQYLFTGAVTPSGSGTLGVSPPSGDGYYNSGQVLTLTASANPSFKFNNFSGDVTGTTNPALLTMSAPRSVTANFVANTVPCTYSIFPSGQTFPSSGGSGSIAVTAPNGCPWSIDSSLAPFVTGLTITPGGNSGSGNGTVTYSVPANGGTTTRTATLTVAGQPYSISEAPPTQPGICTASAGVPPTVALEGRTEVLGDLVLNCVNLSGSTTTDVTLTLNTNVTNQLTSGSTTDATLTVGGTTYNGQVLGYNTVHFPGVAVGPGTVALRISKVRADVSLLAGANVQPIAVTGQVSFTGTQPAPIINGLQTLAFALTSLTFQKGQANPPAGGAQTIVPLAFSEGFASAFNATGTPTRLRVVLTNVPGTVQVFAPVFPNEGTNKAQLYSADSNGAGGGPVTGSPMAGGTYQQLVGSGTFVMTWVVSASDAFSIEKWTFPLLLGNAALNDLNAIQVSASVAVVSDVGVASATAPVPRYRDFSVPQKLVNLRLSVQTQSLGASSSKSTERSASFQTLSATSGVGSNVSFTYTLLNDTADPSQTAMNATIRNNLPSGLNFVSCTASGGATCQGSGSQIQVSYNQVVPGGKQTVTVVATVDPTLKNGTVLTNVAGASSDQITADPETATTATSLIVLNGTPIPIGSSPSAGSGANTTFTYTFTHPYGFQNLFVVNVLFKDGLDARNACYLAYVVPINTLVLVNDQGEAGGNFAGTVALGDHSVIQNSQCAVSLVNATGAGLDLTLQLNITFKPAFGGNKIAFIAARDQALDNSDWQALGVWQAPFTSPVTITANNMSPSRGSAAAGTAQSYSFTFTDTKGPGDIGIIDILVNNGLDGAHACYLAYVASINKILLLNDAGDQGGNFIGAISPGDPISIENSQCALNGSGGGTSTNGNSFILTFNLTFKAAFQGNKIFYLAARDSSFLNNTDWQAMGTWGVQ